jgi:hypothetical protein
MKKEEKHKIKKSIHTQRSLKPSTVLSHFFLVQALLGKTYKPNIHFRRFFFVIFSQQYLSVYFVNGVYIFP